MIYLRFLPCLLVIFLFIFQFSFAQNYTLSSQDLGVYVTLGIAWGDYDGDGDDDLYMTNGNPSDGTQWVNYLFRNNGDGTFTRIEDNGPIVSDVYLSAGTSWADYDNDGDLDLMVANPKITQGSGSISLYANNGSGSFSNASAGDLTTTVSFSRIDAAWADANNDGLLDVLVSNANLIGLPARAHAYFINNGNGTFSSVSNNMTAGTSAKSGVAWIDVDNDGDMDAVTCSGAPGQKTVLWVNTGSNFTELVLIDTGEGIGRDTQGASWGDYDNDGDFDLYLVNRGENGEANVLFRNDGVDGNGLPIMTQLDGNSGVGPLISDVDFSIASAWVDVDNDGDLDLFVGNDGGYAGGYRSRLYINNNGVFTSETSGNLIENADFVRSTAVADIDNDGDMEIVIGRDGPNRLFINNLDNGNNWVQFNLTGVNANRSAIGAVIRVKATINGNEVWQMRDVSSHTGTASQSSMRVHFGLGNATVIDELVIRWPGSGLVETLNNVAVNQIIPLIEGQVSSLIAMNEPVPAQYQLFQNYPNPFNPDTKIRFHLPVSGQVQLEIYNVLGNKVATLVDCFKSAGVYEYTFQASDLSSGVYFYRLTSSGFISMKKMMVLK